MPLLKNQSQYQRNPKVPEKLQFWEIDRFKVPEKNIKSWKLTNDPKVVELRLPELP